MELLKWKRVLCVLLAFQLTSSLAVRFSTADGAEACGKDGVCTCIADKEATDSFVVLCNITDLKEVPKNIPRNVTALSFYRRNITTFDEEKIQELTNLEILLLTKTKISKLQKNIFASLIRLTRLYLNENRLTQLPTDVFCPLKNLIELNLGGNQLEAINEKIFHDLGSLRTLSIRNNKLYGLPEKIFKNSRNLRDLDLSGNSIHSLSVNTFVTLGELHLLNLTNNKLKSLPNHIFKNTTKLKHLYLEHNQLENLSHVLIENLTYMQYFYVSNNNINQLSQEFKFPSGVKYIRMSNNKLVELPQNFLKGIQHLISVLLDGNQIKVITEEFKLHDNLVQLTLANNNLQELYENLATPLHHLYELDLSHNNISAIPESLFSRSQRMKSLSFSSNIIKTMNGTTFCGLKNIHWLYLSRNSISRLPEEIFSPFNLTGTLDLSSNSLTELPANIFQTDNEPHFLEVLLLQRNNLHSIPAGVFKNLPQLKTICLFYNKIHFLVDEVFHGHAINFIYLFGNAISELRNQSFEGQNISQIHLYRNNISYISDKAVSKARDNTTLFLSCDKIDEINPNISAQIKCVTPTYVPEITVDFNVVNYFRSEGFHCTNIGLLIYKCAACQRGTYGNGYDGCSSCPRGGFYQDDIGVTPSKPGELTCKKCTNGTYSRNEKATSAEDCIVCPEGTNKKVHAGFRACPCIDGYARKDRFGPCEPCAEDGVNCSGQDFRTIKPGYFWSWNFNVTSLQSYKDFVANLKIENSSYIENHTIYFGEIPRVHKCPRQNNCENTLDNINGSCAKGYKGWLCTQCQKQYYSVMNNCIRCPSTLLFLVEIASVVLLCLCVYLIILLHYKYQKKKNKKIKRSIVDILFARGKILLGFYQVVGEFFKSLNEVKWIGKLYVIGEFIFYLEFNILKVFVRPQCIKEGFIINPKIEFIFGMSFPLLCVTCASVIYLVKKVWFKYKFPTGSITEYQETFRSKLMTYLVIVLFVTYPPICTTVFQLYPRACQKFCLDVNKRHCVHKLRSDYDIDCNDLTVYHTFAYIATFCYVIFFPSFLLYLLKKYRSHGRILRRCESCNASKEELESLIQGKEENRDQPSWMHFLSESYKQEYWYWEIIELTRKVTQTVLITLLGWEHKLTVLLTIGISVLFLTLHARYMPMKSSFEQKLQMFSLSAILINVLIAGMEFSEKYDNIISNFLILLNVVVIIIIAAEAIFRLFDNLRKIGIHKIVRNICGAKKTDSVDMKTL